MATRGPHRDDDEGDHFPPLFEERGEGETNGEGPSAVPSFDMQATNRSLAQMLIGAVATVGGALKG